MLSCSAWAALVTSAFGLSAFTADIFTTTLRISRISAYCGARVLEMSYPSSQVERNYVLYARMQNAKNLFTLLKAINFKEVNTLYHIILYTQIHLPPHMRVSLFHMMDEISSKSHLCRCSAAINHARVMCCKLQRLNSLLH